MIKIILKCSLLLLAFMQQGTAVAQSGKLLFPNPPGIEAYTYRNSWNNVKEVLDTIKALGITEMEGGSIKGVPDQQFRAMLDERGIKMVAIGAGYESLTDENKLREVIQKAKLFGATYIMVAWIPHNKSFELADADKAIAVFNNAGKTLKKNGLTFCYHIHGYEFKPYQDGTLFDYMVKKLKPSYVSFEIDILWAFFGGQDPAKLMLKYPTRWKLMHIKDLKKGVGGNLSGNTAEEHDVAAGTGQLKIPEIMRAAKKVGIRHYFIEDESPHHAIQIPQTIAYLQSLKE